MRRWDVIIKTVPKDRDIVGAEIGVYKGITARSLLHKLKKLRLYLVDRWEAYPPSQQETTNPMTHKPQKHFNDVYRLVRKLQTTFPHRTKILKMDSIEAAKLVTEKLDFVFIDARHDYEGVKADIKAWKGKVKKGGFIMGHDYDHPNHPDVKKAVDEIFPDITQADDYVWIARK